MRDANITVTNPATGATVGVVRRMHGEEIAQLVARARSAQPAWDVLGFRGRAALLRDFQAWLLSNRALVTDAMVAEAGKVYEDTLPELLVLLESLRFWSSNGEKYLREERLTSFSPLTLGRRVVTRHCPLGVVGVIAPWNYPVALGFGDAIPALMAGNSVVLKPSGITPLSSLVLAEGLAEVGFPTDVLLVATGRGDAGTALVDHADMIMFTGSTETGKVIAKKAAERLIPASLELGGNDPMIVLADANLERAANTALLFGMANNGQTCMAVERIFVEAPVYDSFVDRLVAKTTALRQGAGAGPGGMDIGALTGPGQIDIVERQVQDAVSKGARILCGGTRGARSGDFFHPTVLVDVDLTMECMREETFGPVLAIARVADAEEAIALANATSYGLNSSVFTRDIRRGEAIARRMEAGAACVNDAVLNYVEMRAPFAGWKQSGLGGRHGQLGIRKYTKPQTVLLTRWAPSRDPMMFPNRRVETRAVEAALQLRYGSRAFGTRVTKSLRFFRTDPTP